MHLSFCTFYRTSQLGDQFLLQIGSFRATHGSGLSETEARSEPDWGGRDHACIFPFARFTERVSSAISSFFRSEAFEQPTVVVYRRPKRGPSLTGADEITHASFLLHVLPNESARRSVPSSDRKLSSNPR